MDTRMKPSIATIVIEGFMHAQPSLLYKLDGIQAGSGTDLYRRRSPRRTHMNGTSDVMLLIDVKGL